MLPINQGSSLRLQREKTICEKINPCKERIAEDLEGFLEINLLYCNGELLDSERINSIPVCKIEVISFRFYQKMRRMF